MFKATVEKLEKGWDVSVSVPDFDSAKALVSELHGSLDADAPAFRSTIKKLKDATYRVVFYQSTLTDAQVFIKDLFKKNRVAA